MTWVGTTVTIQVIPVASGWLCVGQDIITLKTKAANPQCAKDSSTLLGPLLGGLQGDKCLGQHLSDSDGL